MSREWFYMADGAKHGPATRDELLEALANRSLHGTLVWRAGLGAWAAIETLPEFADAFRPPVPPTDVGTTLEHDVPSRVDTPRSTTDDRDDAEGPPAVFAKLSPLALLLAILCFPFPFITVSCDTGLRKEFTGVQLATGFTVNQPQMFGPPVEHHTPPDPYIAFSLIAGVVGFAATVRSPRRVFGALSGGLAALSLFLFKFQMDNRVAQDPAAPVHLQYENAFFLALAAFAGAAVLSLLSKEVEGLRSRAASASPPIAPPIAHTMSPRLPLSATSKSSRARWLMLVLVTVLVVVWILIGRPSLHVFFGRPEAALPSGPPATGPVSPAAPEKFELQLPPPKNAAGTPLTPPPQAISAKAVIVLNGTKERIQIRDTSDGLPAQEFPPNDGRQVSSFENIGVSAPPGCNVSLVRSEERGGNETTSVVSVLCKDRSTHPSAGVATTNCVEKMREAYKNAHEQIPTSDQLEAMCAGRPPIP
jgi:hypothetical protein